MPGRFAYYDSFVIIHLYLRYFLRFNCKQPNPAQIPKTHNTAIAATPLSPVLGLETFALPAAPAVTSENTTGDNEVKVTVTAPSSILSGMILYHVPSVF
jgi:hypothetical protein